MEPKKGEKSSPSPSETVLKIDNEMDDKYPETSKSEVSVKLPKKPLKKTEVILFEDKNIELVEDVFGSFVDSKGSCHKVKRYTWTNHNRIQVQVINYGARIISMKLPDRKGTLEDIVLGCEDLAGYLYYGSHYLGATIGRVTNVIKNGTYVVDGHQEWLSQNKDPHHFNGGIDSIDKAVWATFIEGKKVIMSHISPHMDNGYPGNLLIRVSFELSNRNEFNINMEAQTTAPTLVNLSNLTYFNLAGHHAGPDETYKHLLTLNCNCFTPIIKDLPTGEILNVIYTEYDFQVPKLLGKVMGIIPKDGFNQNLCVNRGVDQDNGFVARILHPPSGRMIEIYSNQFGVNLSTANDFGYGERLNMSQILPTIKQDKADTNELEEKLLLFNKIHEEMFEALKIDREKNFQELLNLIMKIKLNERINEMGETDSSISLSELIVSPLQKKYLHSILEFVCQENNKECKEIQTIVSKLLSIVEVENKDTDSIASEVEKSESQIFEELRQKNEKIKKQKEFLNETRNNVRKRINYIPPYYKDSKNIIGKNGARYKMHSGIALQTQNYPNAINFKNFPSSVVKPGETYKHSITYKFWIRAGNPTKWMKRNLNDNKAKSF